MVGMSASINHRAWLTVAMFEEFDASRGMAAFLKEKGFEARTYDDKFFRYFLFLRPPRVTYRVQVRRDHFAAVLKLLNETAPPAADEALHCPDCGSLRVNYPQMTRQFILPTILLHLGIIFRVIEHQCYCENCQEMWTLPKERSLHSKPREVKPFPF